MVTWGNGVTLFSPEITNDEVLDPMVGKIEQWDDSLGVRIPQAVAEQGQFHVGSTVTITLENGRLILAPEEPMVFSLQDLLAKVTPENIHSETDWGPAVGNEVW
jgi:antitoxin MazE